MQRFLNFLIIFLSNFSYIWSQNFWLYMGNFFSSRIIWFGDLNYRISLSRDDAKRLVEMKDWPALFNKDQVLSLCQRMLVYVDLKIWYMFPFCDLESSVHAIAVKFLSLLNGSKICIYDVFLILVSDFHNILLNQNKKLLKMFVFIIFWVFFVVTLCYFFFWLCIVYFLLFTA